MGETAHFEDASTAPVGPVQRKPDEADPVGRSAPIVAVSSASTSSHGTPTEEMRFFGSEGGPHGVNNDCTIPTDAVAVLMNVTADRQTASNSFLSIWGSGANPGTSALNPAAGEPPTPNAVTTDLTGAGVFNVYNDAGSVDLIIDINGYHTKTSLQQINTRLAALEAANPGPRIAVLEAVHPMVLVEHAESGNVNEAIFGGTTDADVLTATINVPAAGHLIITSTLDVFGPSANSFGCEIFVDGSFVSGSVMFTSVGDPGNGEGICATTVTKAVSAGSHPVVLHARNRAAETLDDAALSVIWVRNV